jgi:hypothetical protein
VLTSQHLVVSAIILWELKDYFGPSVLKITLPLLCLHSIFVFVVLFANKAVHFKHKAALRACKTSSNCISVDDFFDGEYVFGYDTYNSLRISLSDAMYSKEHHNNTCSDAFLDELESNLGCDRCYCCVRKMEGHACHPKCRVSAIDHAHVIAGCVMGIVGLNLFEFQNHTDPNYYPVVHEMWHLLMAASFYSLFYNNNAR